MAWNRHEKWKPSRREPCKFNMSKCEAAWLLDHVDTRSPERLLKFLAWHPEKWLQTKLNGSQILYFATLFRFTRRLHCFLSFIIVAYVRSFSFLPQSNVAQETLNQVQGIETAMNSSEHIRQQVMSLQQETDGMVADINNITQTVRKKNRNSARRYCHLLGNFGA